MEFKDVSETLKPFIEKFRSHFRAVRATVSNFLKKEHTPRTLAILFVLAILMGATVKSAVSDTLTIGFEDYKLLPAEKLVDLNGVQKQVLGEGGSLALSGTAAQGKACSQ